MITPKRRLRFRARVRRKTSLIKAITREVYDTKPFPRRGSPHIVRGVLVCTRIRGRFPSERVGYKEEGDIGIFAYRRWKEIS